jgi:hypothetical protein
MLRVKNFTWDKTELLNSGIRSELVKISVGAVSGENRARSQQQDFQVQQR